jgi:acetylornithine deacetylase/succinyl-diaminopimelate desuccinylase-like protein
MYGRGAADMKAGVVAMLGAVRVLADAGLAGDVFVETVIEEECTGNGAAACRARCPRTSTRRSSSRTARRLRRPGSRGCARATRT